MGVDMGKVFFSYPVSKLPLGNPLAIILSVSCLPDSSWSYIKRVWMKHCVALQMKAIDLFFHVMFIMLYTKFGLKVRQWNHETTECEQTS